MVASELFVQNGFASLIIDLLQCDVDLALWARVYSCVGLSALTLAMLARVAVGILEPNRLARYLPFLVVVLKISGILAVSMIWLLFWGTALIFSHNRFYRVIMTLPSVGEEVLCDLNLYTPLSIIIIGVWMLVGES